MREAFTSPPFPSQTFLSADDLEGLNHLYPTCDGARQTPHRPAERDTSGWLRLLVAVSIPFVATTLLLAGAMGAVREYHRRRLGELEREASGWAARGKALRSSLQDAELRAEVAEVERAASMQAREASRADAEEQRLRMHAMEDAVDSLRAEMEEAERVVVEERAAAVQAREVSRAVAEAEQNGGKEAPPSSRMSFSRRVPPAAGPTSELQAVVDVPLPPSSECHGMRGADAIVDAPGLSHECPPSLRPGEDAESEFVAL